MPLYALPPGGFQEHLEWGPSHPYFCGLYGLRVVHTQRTEWGICQHMQVLCHLGLDSRHKICDCVQVRSFATTAPKHAYAGVWAQQSRWKPWRRHITQMWSHQGPVIGVTLPGPTSTPPNTKTPRTHRSRTAAEHHTTVSIQVHIAL